MDPISATASILGILDVALRTTSALVDYIKNTQSASSERHLLAEEALSLSKLLERLRDRAQGPNIDTKWIDERVDLVRQFVRAYEDLATSLKFDTTTGQLRQESRIKIIRTLSKWSFTKGEVYSILERITRLQQYANILLMDEQHTLVERIESRQQEASDKKQKSAILSWISPLQMAQIHQTVSGRPEKGSGRWFLTSGKFLQWEMGKHRLLWCSGIPGAGKTVIASIAVDHLHRQRLQDSANGKIGVAVIYLKYNDPEQTLEAILGSLLRQLAQDHSSMPWVLNDLYETHREQNTAPSLAEISEALSSLVEEYSKVYLVIDALDECSDEIRWDLVEKLRGLPPETYLMITSRFLDSIDKDLEDFERIEIKANKADLELFVDHHIERNKNLHRVVERSTALRVDIKYAVVRTAQDMFLLARLHVESLASAAALSIKHVRKKLQTLPTTLVGTYDEAMQRIEIQEPDHRALALKTLAWVSYAFRSLSLGELQHALAIEPGQTDLDEELLMDSQSITALCAGLVIVDQATNAVNLVHYTTKNYFENIRAARFPGFHATITMSCATYLALSVLKDASVWTIVRCYPLACYAAQYMGDHARQNPEEALEPSILEVICRLLSHPDKRKPLLSLLDGLDLIKSGFYASKALDIFQDDTGPQESSANETVPTQTSEPGKVEPESEMCSVEVSSTFSTAATELNSIDLKSNLDRESTYNAQQYDSGEWDTQIKSSRIPEVTALHLAASMGLAKVASMLLKESPNVDAVDETGKTALAVAMERGFEKAVEFLVKSGAIIDLGSEHGQVVFLLIAENDWHTVAEIVAAKARMTTSDSEFSNSKSQILTLLSAYYGDKETALSLIERNVVDLIKKDRHVGAMALFLATERKNAQLLQILLNAGVDVNSRDSMGQASLHRATRRESAEIIRVLLNNGAEVDLKNDDGRTAWSANVKSRNKSISEILLHAGANPSTRGHQGVSELYTAATDGEIEYVRFMLESGTDPSIKTQFGWAPLHWAAYYGHLECVKMLINAGADLSPVSDQDATPLDLALRANQIVIVDLLTRAGAKETRDITVLTPSVSTEELTQQVLPSNASSAKSSGDADSRVKISLIFDKPVQQGLMVGQFIYCSNFTALEYIYHISHTLDTSMGSLGIRHAQKRADMIEYPLPPDSFDAGDDLYEIVRVTLDYQELELRPNKQSPISGTITMHRDWTGGWKIHHIHDGIKEYLCRTTPDWSKMKEEGCRWMTEDGTLLARTSWDGVTPVLCFELGSTKRMQDILVSCWVAKLWSETVALQRRASGATTLH